MSLYEDLGGEPAIAATVEHFYDKVLADPLISGFFADLDMQRQRQMMRHFVTFAFGGPQNYSGRSMRNAHRGTVERGLEEQHFDRVLEHLGATLQELGVSAELIGEAAEVVNSVRADVLGQ